MKPTLSELLKNPEIAKDDYWTFYDWFCDKNTLESRFRKALPKVKFLVNEGLVDPDKCYMTIKNCDSMFGTYDAIRIHHIDADEDLLTDVILVINAGRKRNYYENGRIIETTQHDAEITLYDPYGFTSRFDDFCLRSNTGVFKSELWSELKNRIKTDETIKEAIKTHCVDFKNSREVNKQRNYQYSLKKYCDYRNELIEQGYSECTPCRVLFCSNPWTNKVDKTKWVEDKWLDHVA